MARAHRHYIPGHTWHITHRRHKREFLLKFAKDRHRWLQWLYQSRKRYGQRILDYIVTSNHIHLLVNDARGGETPFPNRFSYSLDVRPKNTTSGKRKKGAFWEDRYHATIIEKGEHLLHCSVYIDLNMVRAGIIDHPGQWPHSGYNDIQHPRRKKVLIDYNVLFKLTGFDDYDRFQAAHRKWIEGAIEQVSQRYTMWTEAIAVGSELREPVTPYKAHFGNKKSDIGPAQS